MACQSTYLYSVDNRATSLNRLSGSSCGPSPRTSLRLDTAPTPPRRTLETDGQMRQRPTAFERHSWIDSPTLPSTRPTAAIFLPRCCLQPPAEKFSSSPTLSGGSNGTKLGSAPLGLSCPQRLKCPCVRGPWTPKVLSQLAS